MTGYDGLGLDSPKLGSSPKYSEETVTCDSDGKPGHDDYIKGKVLFSLHVLKNIFLIIISEEI